MKPRRISFPVMGLCLCGLSLFGQDKFPVTRMTYDPAQDGFASWYPDGRAFVYSSLSGSPRSTRAAVPDHGDSEERSRIQRNSLPKMHPFL